MRLHSGHPKSTLVYEDTFERSSSEESRFQLLFPQVPRRQACSSVRDMFSDIPTVPISFGVLYSDSMPRGD